MIINFFVIFGILFLFSGHITRLFNRIFARIHHACWLYLYRRYERYEPGLSVEQFRPIFFWIIQVKTREWWRRSLNRLHHSVYNLFGKLVDLLRSPSLDQLRIRYGQWINLRLIHRYLDFFRQNKTGSVEVRVLSMERIGTFNIIHVFYTGRTAKRIPAHIINSLATFLHIPHAEIHVQIVDAHHLKVVFPMPE